MRTLLILAANPKGITQLRLNEELKKIEQALQRSRKREEFNLVVKLAVTDDELRQALLDNVPEIVHFAGHGTGKTGDATARELIPAEAADTGGLAFEDDNGSLQLISGDALARLFSLFTDSVKCVILNACYSEIQANSISEHIDYVIGMKQAIEDKAAIKFSVGFYDALGAGKDFDQSFAFGRSAIDLKGIPEHLTPVIKKKAAAIDENPAYEIKAVDQNHENKPKGQEFREGPKQTPAVNTVGAQPKPVILTIKQNTEARKEYEGKIERSLLDQLESIPVNEAVRLLSELLKEFNLPTERDPCVDRAKVVEYLLGKEISIPLLKGYIKQAKTFLSSQTVERLDRCSNLILPWHFSELVGDLAPRGDYSRTPGYLHGFVVTRIGADLVMASVDRRPLEIRRAADGHAGVHGKVAKGLPPFGKVNIDDDAEQFLTHFLERKTQLTRSKELQWYMAEMKATFYCVVELPLSNVDEDYAVKLLKKVSVLQPDLPIICLTRTGPAKDDELRFLGTLLRERENTNTA